MGLRFRGFGFSFFWGGSGGGWGLLDLGFRVKGFWIQGLGVLDLRFRGVAV